METIKEKIAAIDWQIVTSETNEKGFALVPQLLSNNYCDELIRDYDDPALYRKTLPL